MDLALPPMPFSAVFHPLANAGWLRIAPEFQVPSDTYSALTQLELPAGVVQVIITWQGTEPLLVHHFRGDQSENIATIPGVSSPTMRSTGVLTLASKEVQALRVMSPDGASVQWSTTTLDRKYVAGVQVMPMGTAADVTGGGSMLRVDNSVGTRVFLGDQMIYGDTGWRRITLPDGESWLLVRRQGDLVELQLSIAPDPEADPTPVTEALNGLVPYSFTPSVGLRPLYREGGGVPSRLMFLGADGSTTFYSRRLTYRADLLGLTYFTKRPWPSTLPGIAG